MRLNDAVDAVTGEVFREGWSRIRGSMQRPSGAQKTQLARAAAGYRPAVFKAIRGGGTHTKTQLSNQLEYLTTKSTHIVDSTGFLDGKAKLGSKDIMDLTERFAKRWEAGFKPKLGQTTHMLMSFPIGTHVEDVRDIASDVADRFFQTPEGHFDFIMAVHNDRDHPHAHLVLNRRSQEGEFFFLRRDHRFNYDDFRLAMVEEAERYGVRLEATRRVDRGVMHYPARTGEVYIAKEEGRLARERERGGDDLTRTLAEIAEVSILYHSLATEAAQDSQDDLADVLFRASEMLANGFPLKASADIYLGKDMSLRELKALYVEKLERVQGMIAEKPEAERPQMEKRLIEIQSQVKHLQPLGTHLSKLSQAPSQGGIYSEVNIQKSQLERLSERRLRSQINGALLDTGMTAGEVIARIETGAPNAALEHLWIADDLTKVVTARGLNLELGADQEEARSILNHVHVELGSLLKHEKVLRRDSADKEDPDVRAKLNDDQMQPKARTVRQLTPPIKPKPSLVSASAGQHFSEQQIAFLNDHPELTQSPADVIRKDQEGHLLIANRAAADRIARAVNAALNGAHSTTPIELAVGRHLLARYPEMPEPLAEILGESYANVQKAMGSERTARILSTPELNRALACERVGQSSEPFELQADRDAFRTEIATLLDEDQLDRLTSGDADALHDHIEDRLDRLYATKIFLQSDPDTIDTQALCQVVKDLADIELEEQRDTDAFAETERGLTHG